ncbi:EamA family transporter [Nibricoccus sp. IMCC34717]|uniref:EamA family transporter n=1 Tax=Nibricoccus sp. IMCC34717 TaxID=3034021 RepID=UPI00384FAB1E
MAYLVVVSFVWAFSFGLTKGKLTGLESSFISAARLGLAALVFLPFLRWRGLGNAARWMAIGAVQFGAMYVALNESYHYLPSHLVALFTLTTPLFVVAIDALGSSASFVRPWLAALLSVGAGLLVTRLGDPQAASRTWAGLAFVQIANACFAFGQIAYRRSGGPNTAKGASEPFAWMYLGAFLSVAPLAWMRNAGAFPALTQSQLITLVYLGCLASGVCFFLWNVGAARVSTGALAVMNNAKVPLAVACSLLFFGEKADVAPLAGAFALLGAAVFLVRRRTPA